MLQTLKLSNKKKTEKIFVLIFPRCNKFLPYCILFYQAVVANMISIFRKMSPAHYDQYIHNFNVNDPAGRCDLVTVQ
jgi:hypothetical protein